MSRRLVDIARVVRSKNAGPGTLTLDLFFETEADFRAASQAPGLSPEAVAALYDVPEETVRVIPYAPANAIKIAMARKVLAGSPGDRDVYGAQQHALVLDIEIPKPDLSGGET